MYRSVLHAILEAKGELVEEGVWGDIVVEEIVEAGETTSVYGKTVVEEFIKEDIVVEETSVRKLS